MVDENYVMEITYGAGTLTFPITPKFFPSLSFNWKRSGHEVAVIDTVPVHGWFSEADQDQNLTKWNALLALAHNGTFVTFVMKKVGGTVIYRYSHATVENLKAVDFDGGFVNHVEFDFLIREERGVRFPGLVNVEHEDEEIKEIDRDGKVTKKFRRRVLATGVRGITSNARSFVEALKPPLTKMISERIRTVNYDGDVEGIWEFDDSDTFSGDIRRWTETTTYMPGIRSNNWYRTAGIPVLIQGGFGPSALRVQGRIERYDEGFPSATELLEFFNGSVPAETEVVFAERPEIGGHYVTEWNADIPDEPYVWAMDYAYTLEFGEANPRPQDAPKPRNAYNT